MRSQGQERRSVEVQELQSPFSLGVACQFLLFDFSQVDISQCIGMLSYCQFHTDGKKGEMLMWAQANVGIPVFVIVLLNGV